MSCMKLLEIPRQKRTRLVYGDLKGNEGAMTWGDINGAFYSKGYKNKWEASQVLLLQKEGGGVLAVLKWG